MGSRQPIFFCSFCGKGSDKVGPLIGGRDGAYICSECVAIANEIIADRSGHQVGKVRGVRGDRRWWRHLLPGQGRRLRARPFTER